MKHGRKMWSWGEVTAAVPPTPPQKDLATPRLSSGTGTRQRKTSPLVPPRRLTFPLRLTFKQPDAR